MSGIEHRSNGGRRRGDGLEGQRRGDGSDGGRRRVKAGAVLACRNLRKSFGRRPAVDGVSFEVRAGEAYGLLGPNGAGKTTTIRIVCGILRPDEGTARVDGVWTEGRTRLEAKAALG